MSLTLDEKKQWLEGVRRLPSPNCDERPSGVAIDLVVIHGISLPPGKYGGPFIDHLFTNCLDHSIDPYFVEIADLKVSSHIVIDREGGVTQYVPFHLRAWHAGVSEFRGRCQCNDFSIGIELEGCDDQPYTTRQYQTGADIVGLLMAGWPGIAREHIVGHSDVAPGRKTDPGPGFDWVYFHALIGNQHGPNTCDP